MENVADFLNKFENARILLLLHKNADPDAVSSAIALSNALEQLNHKVSIAAAESISKLAQKVLDTSGCSITNSPDFNVDLIVTLDTSTLNQLAGLKDSFINSKAKKLQIDHHPIPKSGGIQADLQFIDEKASSTVGLIYNLFKLLKINMAKGIAVPLILGTIAETAHLQYAALSDFKLLTELMEKFDIKYSDMLEILSTQLDVSERIARIKACQRANVERIKDYLIATSSVGSFEASSARALIRLGADLAAVSSVHENEIRISLRSTQKFFKETKINIGKDLISGISALIGGSGSGHTTAAGANGTKCENSAAALKFIIDYLKKKIN